MLGGVSLFAVAPLAFRRSTSAQGYRMLSKERVSIKHLFRALRTRATSMLQMGW